MRRHVLVAIGALDHRLLRGIVAYASRHNWHIDTIQEGEIPWRWEGDGVLTGLNGSTELTAFSTGKPTVDFSYGQKEQPLSRVVMDHAGAARIAAEHFLDRGFRNFLFYSDSDNRAFEERGTRFCAALREHGCDAEWIKWHKSSQNGKHTGHPNARLSWLVYRIKKAPKPVGIFAASGTLAVGVAEACRASHLEIPGQVAIIGMEDGLLPAYCPQHPITAIDPDFEELGYQGASLLETMMNGSRVSDAPIRIPPAQLIVRQSTDIVAGTHPNLEEAVRYIASNLTNTLDVESVARAVGISRRGLHQKFVEYFHQPPGVFIRRLRIENAKRLLTNTDYKMLQVARMSGFSTINNFFITFKQSCQMSPGKYRKETSFGRGRLQPRLLDQEAIGIR